MLSPSTGFGIHFKNGEENAYNISWLLPGGKSYHAKGPGYNTTVDVNDESLERTIYYICPRCGMHWGSRVIIPFYHARPAPLIHAEDRFCNKHGGGSILDAREDLNVLPHEVLIYELLLEKKDDN